MALLSNYSLIPGESSRKSRAVMGGIEISESDRGVLLPADVLASMSMALSPDLGCQNGMP